MPCAFTRNEGRRELVPRDVRGVVDIALAFRNSTGKVHPHVIRHSVCEVGVGGRHAQWDPQLEEQWV